MVQSRTSPGGRWWYEALIGKPDSVVFQANLVPGVPQFETRLAEKFQKT
jgi:hypothetical protein